MIKHIKCDITEVKEGILLNGVNCQARMGLGVARAYYSKWPIVKESYMDIPKSEMRLGIVQPVVIPNSSIIVFNCWTQKFYGNDGKRYASITAIELCLVKALIFATEHRITKIYTPRIGAGLGGLSWEDEVYPAMKRVSSKYPDITVTVCDKID